MNEPTSGVAMLPGVQRAAAVLWPSFVLAGIANIVFFAWIDPLELVGYDGVLPLSRTAAYSLGFFGFWMLTGASSAATLYFLASRVPPPIVIPAAIADAPFDDDDAPTSER